MVIKYGKLKQMLEQFMTREDAELGDGLFDSIAWLFSEHIKEPDTKEYNSAVVYGNEDSPIRIELYRSAAPLVSMPVDRVWKASE